MPGLMNHAIIGSKWAMKSNSRFHLIGWGLVAGIAFGMIARATLGSENATLGWAVSEIFKPLGQLFLRLIFMVVVPLLFSSLILGIADLGEVRVLGRLGIKSLLMTVVLSSVAVILAIAAVNLVQPGSGISPEQSAKIAATFGKPDDAAASVEKSKEAKGLLQTIVEFVPENPLESASQPKLGGMLPFMVFAVFFGVGLLKLEPEKALPVKQFFEGILGVSLNLIDMAMKFAPIGVFALIFATTATLGVDALMALGKYAALVLVVLALHLFGTYSLAIAAIAKRSPAWFFSNVRGVMLTAFATSSSNATLPTALKAGEENLGIPRPVNSFVLTLGATANQNGTALFEGVTVLFLAQLFGIPLGIPQQLTVVGLAILAGVGTAGVPGGSWPMIAAICATVGIPPGAIAICMGVDRVLDMSRTVVNVVGDLTIATCVSAMEPMESTAAEAAS